MREVEALSPDIFVVIRSWVVREVVNKFERGQLVTDSLKQVVRFARHLLDKDCLKLLVKSEQYVSDLV